MFPPYFIHSYPPYHYKLKYVMSCLDPCADVLLLFVPGEEEGYQDVTLSLMRDGSLNGTGAQEWWDISIADCDVSAGACGVLPMVIFNDKVSPPSLGFLAGYG